MKRFGLFLCVSLLALVACQKRVSDQAGSKISISIHVQVQADRSLTPQQALDATGRRKYTDAKVVQTMPRGQGEEVEVIFFNVGRWISDNDLQKEYELRGLQPADPYSLAQVNEDDPGFSDEHPNGTHWQDAEGRWCFATFYRWRGERRVDVNRSDRDWYGYWWFAGVRKP